MNAPSLRSCIGTWIALLVLLALTCGSSYLRLGAFNLAANLAIAVAKALLVVFVFMRLGSSSTIVRLVAVIGLSTLTLLVGLSMTDFAIRGW
jgi:cytochrome c oxidase subunit 4